MSDRIIAAVEIDSSGRLLVQIEVSGDPGYEHIYREANGLRWSREKRAFYAYEPSRWEYEVLFRHIVASLRSAFDERLRISPETVWVGVSPELQRKFCHALGAA